MTFDFRCPHCGLETEVEDQYAGQSGPCAGCGKTITMPYLTSLPTAESPRHRSSRRSTPAWLLVLIGVGGVLAAIAVIGLIAMLLSPMIRRAQAAADSTQCQRNLKQISLAMQAYHDVHGSYPPALVADDNGRPLHSWRVLLLPYLGESDLYQQYNFDLPWNDPANMTLATLMPPVYACPADPQAALMGETNYMVVTGPGTAFPGREAISTSDIQDPLGTTILVVETPAAGVCWLNPTDLRSDQMQYIINGGKDIGSYHADGANVAFADGSTTLLPEDLSAEYLRAMLTVAGGESLPLEF